jgi:hypothetical protein
MLTPHSRNATAAAPAAGSSPPGSPWPSGPTGRCSWGTSLIEAMEALQALAAERVAQQEEQPKDKMNA